MSAIWIWSLPEAWTLGSATPANAEAAASRPVLLRNSRREVEEKEASFIQMMLPICRSSVNDFSGPKAGVKSSVAVERATLDVPEDLRLFAHQIEQAQGSTGRPAPASLPTDGRHFRNVKQRGKHGLANVKLQAQSRNVFVP